MRCLGAVLAGGEARRFGGEPKGLVRVAGATMLARVRDALAPVVDRDPILVVRENFAARDRVRGWALACDARENGGPLAGLEAALRVAHQQHFEGALVVAWDMPWVTRELLSFIRTEGERAGAAAVPIVRNRLEPLCAYYPVGALESATAALDAGRRAPRDWIAELPRVERLPELSLAQFGDPARLLSSVNSPADLPPESP